MKKVTNKLDDESILNAFKLKKTIPRLRVLSIIADKNMAVAGPVLIKKLKDMNRSTRSKVLNTLEDKGIIYRIFDLNGIVHYALCPPGLGIAGPAVYVNFNCASCKKIYRLDKSSCAAPSLPEGFSADRFMLGIEGICPSCNKKKLLFNKSHTA